MVSFSQAIANFFGKYATFSGRSTRAEYWWVQLFNLIIYVVIYGLPVCYLLATGSSSYELLFNQPMLLSAAGVILIIYGLAILIPGIALTVRRLHDIGRSGWWYLGFVLAIYAVYGLMFMSVFQAALGHGTRGFSGITIVAATILMLVVMVVWLVWLCTPSAPDNEYGPNPESEEYWQ